MALNKHWWLGILILPLRVSVVHVATFVLSMPAILTSPEAAIAAVRYSVLLTNILLSVIVIRISWVAKPLLLSNLTVLVIAIRNLSFKLGLLLTMLWKSGWTRTIGLRFPLEVGCPLITATTAWNCSSLLLLVEILLDLHDWPKKSFVSSLLYSEKWFLYKPKI